MSVLSLHNVTKNFGETEIIRGISLDIDQGEKHAIIGPNGAGKSTLFHLISGLYNVTGGSIKYKDQEIQNKRPYEINRLGLAAAFRLPISLPDSMYLKIYVALYSGPVVTNIPSGICWEDKRN